jgi:hypothetical protein
MFLLDQEKTGCPPGAGHRAASRDREGAVLKVQPAIPPAHPRLGTPKATALQTIEATASSRSRLAWRGIRFGWLACVLATLSALPHTALGSTLAQGRFDEIQRGFEESPADNSTLTYALLALAVLVLAPAAFAIMVRVRQEMSKPDRVAWRGMTQALGLNWSDRRLLALVARQRDLHPAAALLVSRGAFESSVTAYLSQGGATSRAKNHLKRLRKRIFS